jgi:hypothetical protein
MRDRAGQTHINWEKFPSQIIRENFPAKCPQPCKMSHSDAKKDGSPQNLWR